jgi:hypothetical protein
MLAHELLEGLEFHEVPLLIFDLVTPIAQHQQSHTRGKGTGERLINRVFHRADGANGWPPLRMTLMTVTESNEAPTPWPQTSSK